jgi:quercetin dioxygenase-like cupin family protein
MVGRGRSADCPPGKGALNADQTQRLAASATGREDYFTGTVRIDPLFQAPDPARASGSLVTFEPGARSNWHTHPLGQTLIVTAGLGWTQCWGGPIEEIRPGDVIWCPPGVKHWHGATPATAMSHIAIQERDAQGKVVDWLEKVANEQYLAGPRAV